jgi:2-keto-4-pentenoate hydratase/2-oxohepta-3-ene-1,7-dioic acid hydratase in catechol pathway
MRSYDESFDLFDIPFACFVNEKKRQEGNTKDMIFSIPQIISFLSTVWKLMPGDLIYTGTPSGISVIKSRDEIVLNSSMLGRFAWSVL